MGAKDLLREVHLTGGVPASPKKTEQEEKIEHPQETIKEEIPKEKPIRQEVKENTSIQNLPTKVKQVKHPAAELDAYGKKPIATNLQLYNYELNDFLGNFSKSNTKMGGNAITKSQLIEIILSFAYYDLGIKPEGYEEPRELLKDIQAKYYKS